ncbi:MAG: hypothetical protein IPM64_03050 [Phycisphaerales bacterium]|nr:hypothetical protein [Phycisphaerales bacterium]
MLDLLLVPAVEVLIGAALIWLGLRGVRRGKDPHCARCNYDLSATPAGRCPECGADVSAPRAIARGKRKRLPILCWVGGAVCAAGVGYVAVTQFPDLQSPDLYRWTSHARLLDDFKGQDLTLRNRALAEFERRAEEGRLSASQTVELVDACLRHQRSVQTHSDFFNRMAILALRAIREGKATPEQHDTFLRQGYSNMSFAYPAAVRVDEEFTLQVYGSPRLPPLGEGRVTGHFLWRAPGESVVEGRFESPLDPFSTPPFKTMIGSAGLAHWYMQLAMTMPSILPAGSADRPPVVIKSVMQGDIDVFGYTPRGMAIPKQSETWASEAQRNLGGWSVSVFPRDERKTLRMYLNGSLIPPFHGRFGWRVVVKMGGHEFEVGRVSLHPGQKREETNLHGLLENVERPSKLKSFDVRFLPDADAAGLAWLPDYWNGGLLLEGVPVAPFGAIEHVSCYVQVLSPEGEVDRGERRAVRLQLTTR